MKIYRFQTPCGAGPYVNNPDFYFSERDVHDYDKHKTPQDDKILAAWGKKIENRVSQYSFAVATLWEAIRWFENVNKNGTEKFMKSTYALYEIEIKGVDVVLGETQCIFKKDDVISCSKYMEIGDVVKIKNNRRGQEKYPVC